MYLIGKPTFHCNDKAVHGCSIANMRIFVECWRPRRKWYFLLSGWWGRTERTRQFRIKCKHEVCDGQGTARSRPSLLIQNFVTVSLSNAFRGPYIEIIWWPHLRLGCVRAGVTPFDSTLIILVQVNILPQWICSMYLSGCNLGYLNVIDYHHWITWQSNTNWRVVHV